MRGAAEAALKHFLSVMKTRKRLAQILAVFGAVVLITCALLHGTFGYRQTLEGLAHTNVAASTIGVWKAIWLIVAGHWTLVAILVLSVTFGEIALRRWVLFLCGISLLFDSALMFVNVGAFAGSDLIVTAAIAIVVSAALFPAAAPSHETPA